MRFSVFFPQLQGKCQGISRKDGTRSALFLINCGVLCIVLNCIVLCIDLNFIVLCIVFVDCVVLCIVYL